MKERSFLKKTAVLTKIGCGNTKLWQMIKQKSFPPATKLLSAGGLPGRTCYWDSVEVEEWMDKRVAAAKAANAKPRRNDPFGRSLGDLENPND